MNRTLPTPRTSRPPLITQILKQPVALITGLILLVITLASVLAPWIAPYKPDQFDLVHRLSGPTLTHLLGTDELGRDVLSRLLYGGTRALFGVLEATLTVLAIAVPVGILAGYFGGWFDRMVTWFTDLVLAIPAIILVLVVLTLFPGNSHAAMVMLGLLVAPGFARVVRGVTLPLRESDFVAAARVAGVGEARIMLRHILPGVTKTIIVQAAFVAGNALLFTVALGFLGLTSSPGEPEWGQMVASAASQIQVQPWLLVPSGGLIVVLALSLLLLGNALRDATAAVTTESKLATQNPEKTPQGQDPIRAVKTNALLSVRNLTVAFSQGQQHTVVVDRVGFDVMPGEIVGLVGESGAGKSITALSILRLLARGGKIVDGQVVFQGKDLTTLSDAEFDRLRGSQLGLISQEPLSSLDPAFTVGSQLGELVRLHDGNAAVRERSLELLMQVQMRNPERVLSSYPHELSGGMAQRVAIAMALAGRPKLLIADEPTTALDVTVQKEILSLLRTLQRDTGMAVLMVTHNLGVVADLCDRVIVMYAGQVFEDATAMQLFDLPLNPYTLGLLQANPANAVHGEPLKVIPGRVPPPGTWPAHCRFAARCAFATESCTAGPIPLTEPLPGHQTRCIHADSLFLNNPPKRTTRRAPEAP